MGFQVHKKLGKILKVKAWEWRVVLIATPAVAAVILGLRLAGLLQAGEWFFYDQFMRLRPAEASDDRVVIVGIDEDDYQMLGQGQIPDGVLAEAITKIKTENPHAIGLDFYRNLPVNPGHEALQDVFYSTPNLIGIRKVAGSGARETVESAGALQELDQAGSNDVLVDTDGRVRRGLIALKDQQDEWVGSFSMLLANLYLMAEGIEAEFADANNPKDPQDWNLKFNQVILPEFNENDGGYVRADDGGKQVLINYRGPSNHFQIVSLRQVLRNELSPGWAAGKVVLLGPFSEADKDYFPVPSSTQLLGESIPMYGVEIHANLVSQILAAVLDDRPFIRSWPEWLESLWILFWAGVGAAVTWLVRKGHRNPWIQALKFSGASLIVVGGILGGHFWLFLESWWVPVLPSLLAGGGASIAVVAYLAQNAGSIRKTFGRYLSDEIVETLLESPEGLKLGGERRKITILTSDLRGFTATAERLPPEEVIRILNFYLGHMADVITRYRGTIDEFMGDGILVLFGAPTSSGDESDRAVACAIEMQQAMAQVNEQMEEWGYSELEMGIGINTGEVVVGNIGSVKRTKYGVVGSQVNLTYRIESYTTGGQVLVSETTYQELGHLPLTILGTKEVQPKGVKKPILIYDLGGVGSPYNLTLVKDKEQFIEVNPPLPIRYSILSGKHVDDTLYFGYIEQLSRKQAIVRVIPQHQSSPTAAIEDDPEDPTLDLEPLTNLKLNLCPVLPGPGINGSGMTANTIAEGTLTEGEISEDIYAKVLEDPAPDRCFYIYFTAKPPAIAKHFNQIYRAAASPAPVLSGDRA